MQISKLEVKNISYYARGSEETPCYNATVYINGKKAVEVSNDGHGGSDRQHTYPECNVALISINEWCVKKFGQETWEHGGKTYSTDLDLEHYCHQELYNWLDRKTLKKDLLAYYDSRGAEYPSEHNVGHEYAAKPDLLKFYRELDPTNSFNVGIGQSSKSKFWK